MASIRRFKYLRNDSNKCIDGSFVTALIAYVKNCNYTLHIILYYINPFFYFKSEYYNV